MSRASKSLVLAVDFDDTWTADPYVWLAFYKLLFWRGHRMVVATGRKVPQTEQEWIAWQTVCTRNALPRVPIIFCNGQLKEKALRDAGWTVDIWIDDTPGMIQECRILGDPKDDNEL